MIRYLVSDLDGTLLQKDETIASSDVEAILRFKEAHNHFFVASGRPCDFMSRLEELGVKAEYMFGSTGAVISDGTKEEVVGAMDKDIAKRLSELLDSLEEVDYIIDARKFCGFYAKDVYGHFRRHMRTARILDVRRPSEFFKNDEAVLKFFVICKDDEVADLCAKAIDKEFSLELKSYHADRGCLEVVKKDTGKWPAIKKFLDEKGIDKSEVACIGDEGNDIEMIENCGFGFAMASAKDEVKAKAKKVVASVAEAIAYLGEVKDV